MMNKIYETELFPPVKTLLIKNNFSICSEIQYCDIAAMKDDQLVIVELKTSLTLNLLLQAVKRQRLTDYVFVAIPESKLMKTKKWKDIILLIKRLGLGLIVVRFKEEPYAEVLIEPMLFDIIKSQKQAKIKRKKLIKEFNGRSYDLNIGGSSKKKIMTAYKEQSLYIACCIHLLGPLSPKKLKELGSHSKKTNSILIKNFNHWFYRVKTGIYDISEEGIKAITHYHEITTNQIDSIKKRLTNNNN
ncbi:hypothetical protein KHQ81_11385 [Mycoplasmatota bacterium]|nr:hypothetical protein KHQ81_11385 [Mycoplasmatota bacterium]